MNLKGHTTIQLFDKETGLLEKEIQSDNLVTNAVNNLLNFDKRVALSGGSSLNTFDMYSILSPIASKLYGGLMIFGNTLTESADYIIPTPEDIASLKAYGCRQGSVAGNTKRGSFNVSESSITDTSATMVWDFTTEQANGVLKSVALTSDWGGDSAWDDNQLSLAKTSLPFSQVSSILSIDRTIANIAPRDLSAGSVCANKSTPSSMQNRLFTHNNSLISVFATTSSGTEFKVVVHKMDREVGLSTLLSNDVNFGGSTPALVFNSSDIASAYLTEVTSDGTSAVFAKTTETYVGGVYTTLLDVLEVTYDGSLVSYTETTYTLTNIRIPVPPSSLLRHNVSVLLSGDYIYLISRTGEIYKILKSNTSIIEQLPIAPTTHTNLALTTFNKKIALTKRDPDIPSAALYSYIYILDEISETWVTVSLNVYADTTNGARKAFYATYNLDLFKDPIFIATIDTSSYWQTVSGNYLYTNFYSAYLATINNLETPVTKTSSQTMKVIYTLTTA